MSTIEPSDTEGGGSASSDLRALLPMHCNTADDILFANVRSAVARDIPILHRVPAHDGVAILVGGGPSIADDLSEIKAHVDAGAHVFALNGAAGWLIDRGLIPYAQVILDARETNERFLWVCHDSMKFYLASQCHPVLFDRLAGHDVTLWHANYGGQSGVVENRETVIVSGGTVVGLHAMTLAHVLGYRTLHLYGYDSSYRGDANHAYSQPENDGEEIIRCEVKGREFFAAPWMIRQADDFQDVAMALADLGCDIHTHGTGLLPTLAHAMTRVKTSSIQPGELTAFYDLTHSPASYDIATFLAFAEQARIKRGLRWLKVVIASGPSDGFRYDLIPPLETKHRLQMLWGICMQFCRLLPSISTVVLAKSRQEAAIHDRGDVFPEGYSADRPIPHYGHMLMIDELRKADIAVYRAPEWSVDHVRQWLKPNTITITLRETHYGSYRNSDPEAWIEAVEALSDAGYAVLFIRDTEMAFGGDFHGWPVCHAASFDLAYKLAVYECAAVNLFIANAFTMAILAPGVKGIVFGLIRDGESLSAECWAARGFPMGSQYPHVDHRFRVVWDGENSDVIVRETLKFLHETKPQEIAA